MGLEDYGWDTRYSSATHNLIKDFYVPALSQSRFYYRIAGYFSSTAIAAAAQGISAFVERGEKMYLLIGSELSPEDAAAMTAGEENFNGIVEKKWEECLEDFNHDVVKRRFELLAWLIAHGKLEIKIGFNKRNDGTILHADVSKFHEKIMIFEDDEHRMIQTDGSINETWKAWRENRESFCVHKSWVLDQRDFITSAKKEFDAAWNNLDERCVVIDAPEALKLQLLKFYPETPLTQEEEIALMQEAGSGVSQETRELRKYQQEAIEAWRNNNHVGVLEMATGTGKTFTALKAIQSLPLDGKMLLVAVPQMELAHQWATQCEKVIDSIPLQIILCHSGETGWKESISRELRIAARENKLAVVIVVMNTMQTSRFQEAVKEYLDNAYVIIDEVHEIGSSERRKLLEFLSPVRHRLGLSATPERTWDDTGNDAIKEYFDGEPIFRWDLEKAIKPPAGYEQCLCAYEYFIHDCNFNDEELELYRTLSAEISHKIAVLTKGGKIPIRQVMDDARLNRLMTQRANLHKACQDKLRVLKDILNKNSHELRKCLIYCNDIHQMEAVTSIVLGNGFRCLQFFGELDADDRERTFEEFRDGDTQFLIAIKCLDQGVDIPVIDSAIILASSRNPREYVQRRGRILRLHKDKSRAVIHDLFVLPYPKTELETGSVRLEPYEVTLLEMQLERVKIFAEHSLNHAKNLLTVLQYGSIISNSRPGA